MHHDIFVGKFSRKANSSNKQTARPDPLSILCAKLLPQNKTATKPRMENHLSQMCFGLRPLVLEGQFCLFQLQYRSTFEDVEVHVQSLW